MTRLYALLLVFLPLSLWAQSAPPTFSPPPGNYTSAQNVSITCPSGKTATYREDGKQPTTIASKKYLGAITVVSTETISAICSTIGAYQTNLPAGGPAATCSTPIAATFPSGVTCASSGGVGSVNPTNLTWTFGSISSETLTAPANQGSEIQALWKWLFGGNADPSAPTCDACTEQVQDIVIVPTAGSSIIANNEMDMPQYDITRGINRQNGLQCNQQQGKFVWQVDSGNAGGWTDTNVACNLLSGTQYEIVDSVTHDFTTACGGNGCAHYNYLWVNGTKSVLNGTYGNVEGYSSQSGQKAWGRQDQVDLKPTGASPITGGRNILAATVALGMGDESTVVNATYTIGPVTPPSGTATTLTVTASTTTPAVNSQVILTATVSPATANGNVTFKESGSTLGTVALNNGTATFTIAAIAAGTHSYTASYAGNTPVIHYTVDGTAPTSSSTTYSSPITVASTENVQALAISPSTGSSTISAATYNVGTWDALQPQINPYTGTYKSTQSIFLSNTTSGDVMWYTADGSTPDTGGSIYAGSFNVSATSTIKAFSALSYVDDENIQTDTRRVSFGPGWKMCSVTSVGGSTACGGVGSVTPTQFLLTNGQTPSLNSPADSILYSQSTTTSSGSFTDTLVVHTAGNADSGEYATSDFQVWPVCNGLKDNHEFDNFIFDFTRSQDNMFGTQCNATSNTWQYAAGVDGWHDVVTGGSTVACNTGTYALVCGQWNHIRVGNHRIIGDTSCVNNLNGSGAAVPCEHFDWFEINGHRINWNQTITSTVLPSNYTSGSSGIQFQLDSPGTGSSASNPVTSSEYIDQASFRVTGAPSSITTATITIRADLANATPAPVFSPIAGFYAGSTTVTLTDSGAFSASNSNTLSVATTTALTTTTTALVAAQTTVSAKSTDVLTVSVTPAASTGTVIIKDGTTTIATVTLASGSATYTVPALTAGSHDFTAIYSGDSTHQTSTSPLVTVNAAAIVTTSTVSASPSSLTFGGNTTLTANVTPTQATGNFQFIEGGSVIGTVAVASGTGTFVVSAPSAGTHNYTVSYTGDIYYATSSSTATTVTVTNANVNTAISLSTSAGTVTAGASVNLTAAITGITSGGSIVFKDGSSTIGTIAITGGQALLNTGALAAGSHVFAASYSGDSTHNSSASNNITVTVNPVSSATCFKFANLNEANGHFSCQ